MQKCDPKFKTNLAERCYKFGLKVIFLTDKLPNKRSAWVIGDQVMRSATSIGANIVEARAASSRLEFKKFYEISLKSANETKYWLELRKDAGLADKNMINALSDEVTQLANMIAASVIKLKSKRINF